MKIVLASAPASAHSTGMDNATHNTNGDAMNATTNPEICATILQQLGGTGRLSAMTGAHNFIDHGNGASFKVKGNRSPAPNYIKVILNGSDLYDVTFGRLVKWDIRNVEELDSIDAESLKGLIEDRTGLYLSL